MSVPLESLHDAVARTLKPGTVVYLGNFGAQLFSVGHEIIRQRITGLDLVAASGGLLADQLLGAGAVASATFGHCWSPVGPSPAWNFRRLAQSGDTSVTVTEMTLGMLTAALTAGAWNVPFMPFPGLQDTGFIAEGWSGDTVAEIGSPYGATHVVKAIQPDIAFVHVDRCDEHGNGWINGPLGEVSVAASAAGQVVLVTEEIVSTDDLLEHGITIFGALASSIVVAPGALLPDGAAGRYDRDVAAYQAYVEAAATSEGFERWHENLDREEEARR